MKINILSPTILIIIGGLILTSCSTTNQLPKVKDPSYQAYDLSGERGYHVFFELSHDSIQPIALVINRIQQPISKENKVGLKYNVNVISQSKKILGFKPKITNQENGILFKTDTTAIFKPVNFKLLSK